MQDWRVCSRSSVVSGTSEASGEYVSQAMFIQVPIELPEQGPKEVQRLLSLPGKKTFSHLLVALGQYIMLQHSPQLPVKPIIYMCIL